VRSAASVASTRGRGQRRSPERDRLDPDGDCGGDSIPQRREGWEAHDDYRGTAVAWNCARPPSPAVVLVHGAGGIDANTEPWAEEITSVGVAVAVFVMDGADEQEGQ
jgi:hypothetical protein